LIRSSRARLPIRNYPTNSEIIQVNTEKKKSAKGFW
jgi:hypothetical protein